MKSAPQSRASPRPCSSAESTTRFSAPCRCTWRRSSGRTPCPMLPHPSMTTRPAKSTACWLAVGMGEVYPLQRLKGQTIPDAAKGLNFPRLRRIAQSCAGSAGRLHATQGTGSGSAEMAAVMVGHDVAEAAGLSNEEMIARVVALSQDMRAHVVGAVDRMQEINRGIHLLSMNARIEAARAGAAGAGFGVVGQELTRMSENMREAASSLIRESQARGADLDAVLRVLNEDVVASRLCDLAFSAIDIVDRNLYERSCDVRWWATEPAVARALVERSPDALRHASQRLGQILDSYTVYADLVIADPRGQVICNGRPSRYRSVGARVDGTEWFRAAMTTHRGSEFGFQSMHDSELVDGQSILAYSC